jgi:hypothetical protein
MCYVIKTLTCTDKYNGRQTQFANTILFQNYESSQGAGDAMI